MEDERDKIAEAYADHFAEHSIDFQADMSALLQSLWPAAANAVAGDDGHVGTRSPPAA